MTEEVKQKILSVRSKLLIDELIDEVGDTEADERKEIKVSDT